LLNNVTVIALDPGTTETGYVVISKDGRVLLDKGILPNKDMLAKLRRITGAPVHVVIEMVESRGMAVGVSTFETVYWIGRFTQAVEDLNTYTAKVFRMYRRDVKIHTCGTARAKDGNIRQALIDRFEPELPSGARPKQFLKGVSTHEWAALALAFAHRDGARSKL
jgi:Holliday junction resolvasome RuvABC endonuclease subunit